MTMIFILIAIATLIVGYVAINPYLVGYQLGILLFVMVVVCGIALYLIGQLNTVY